MLPRHSIVCSPRAADRLESASRWLQELEPSAEVMVLASRQPAADDLVRALSARRALFGVHRMTPARLLGVLCAERLFRDGLAPAAGLGAEAVAARAIYKLAATGALGYFAPVADRPGFPGALARTLGEVRLAGIGAHELASLDAIGVPLAAMLTQFEAELHDARLVDRAAMLALAAAIVNADPPPRHATMPILMLDVAVASTLEREFTRRSPPARPRCSRPCRRATRPRSRCSATALGVTAPPAARASEATAKSIARLAGLSLQRRRHLPSARSTIRVEVVSAPGEMQECVEIARRILAEAGRGVPFDRIAVALHAPGRYVPYLEEALDRAGIPACFARGAHPARARRPRSARAARLRRRESLRATFRRISFARAGARSGSRRAAALRSRPTSSSPAPRRPRNRWTARPPRSRSRHRVADAADPVPVVEGALRAPWRWENLLVEAAVIGSRERWERRLGGLERGAANCRRSELQGRRRSRGGCRSPDSRPRTSGRRRAAADFRARRAAEERDVGRMARPSARADGARRARSAPVLAALAELEPMAPVGPLGLDEVRTGFGRAARPARSAAAAPPLRRTCSSRRPHYACAAWNSTS